MISETLNINGSAIQKMPQASESIDSDRKKVKKEAPTPQVAAEKSDVQPEELLSQIKALTENGVYSVRFESDDKTEQLVVKIVDNETQEVVRQVPAEELLGLRKALTEFQGNFINTVS